MKDVMRGMFGDDDTLEPLQRLKKLNFKLMLVGIAYLHELISIFKLFMLDYSRPIRFVIIYIKIIFMMAI